MIQLPTLEGVDWMFGEHAETKSIERNLTRTPEL
jgi:hypothetical protein